MLQTRQVSQGLGDGSLVKGRQNQRQDGGEGRGGGGRGGGGRDPPESPLTPSSNSSNFASCPIESGMLPVSLLENVLSRTRLRRFPSEFGMLPSAKGKKNRWISSAIVNLPSVDIHPHMTYTSDLD